MVESVRALLAQVVDYAGLFPPAALAMPEAAAGYARYRAGPDAWALARFVVPAARLDELAAAAEPHLAAGDGPWPLSALGGASLDDDVERVRRFNARHAGRAAVDAFEWRAGDAAALRAGAALLPPGVTGYAELPLGPSVAALVAAAREARVRVKVRTGGVVPDAFPEPRALAGFVATCARLGVAFKATAGLHHPLRGHYPLTYEPASAAAPMFGYLNLFLAAALARQGADEATLERLLTASAPGDFTFDDDGVRWGDHAVSTAEIRRVRADGAVAFGSCSFTEPLTDLAALALR